MKTSSRVKRSRSLAPPGTRAAIHLKYTDARAAAVFVAGTFNNWIPVNLPMRASSPGVWEKDLLLPPGTYEYALVVDGRWRPDPLCPKKIANPYGGSNSVLIIPPD